MQIFEYFVFLYYEQLEKNKNFCKILIKKINVFFKKTISLEVKYRYKNLLFKCIHVVKENIKFKIKQTKH